MAELREIIYTNKIDIIRIQEPLIRYGKLACMPTSTVQIHHSQDAMAAIVITNPSVTTTSLSHVNNQHLIAIEVKIKSTTLLIIKQYCQFNLPTDLHMTSLSNIKPYIKNREIIYTGDVNAKALEWNSEETNKQGGSVLETQGHLGLTIVNKPDQPPTYCNTLGHTSNIDITAATPNIAKRIHSWTVDTNKTSSDHSLITFKLSEYTHKCEWQAIDKSSFSIINADWNKLKEKLKETNMTQFPDSTSEKLAKSITTWIAEACKRTLKCTLPPKLRKCPWWNSTLKTQKNKVRDALHLKQRSKDAPTRDRATATYHKLYKDYKTAIKNAKDECWSNFVEKLIEDVVWSIPQKIVRGKIKVPTALSTVISKEGTHTLGWEDTIRTIALTLFPRDDITIDSEEQIELRRKWNIWKEPTHIHVDNITAD